MSVSLASGGTAGDGPACFLASPLLIGRSKVSRGFSNCCPVVLIICIQDATRLPAVQQQASSNHRRRRDGNCKHCTRGLSPGSAPDAYGATVLPHDPTGYPKAESDASRFFR